MRVKGRELTSEERDIDCVPSDGDKRISITSSEWGVRHSYTSPCLVSRLSSLDDTHGSSLNGVVVNCRRPSITIHKRHMVSDKIRREYLLRQIRSFTGNLHP